MPRLHIMQGTSRKAKRATQPSRPTEITKREITKADALKIAIGGAVIVASLFFGMTKSNNNNAQHEQARMRVQMQRESGAVPGDIDADLAPAQADEAGNQREEENANFQA